jgi:hypothetical protein
MKDYHRAKKTINVSVGESVRIIRELFMSYEDFPWFKDAPVGKVLNVEEQSHGHFYLPDLDVDSGIEAIENPEKFPLKAK